MTSAAGGRRGRGTAGTRDRGSGVEARVGGPGRRRHGRYQLAAAGGGTPVFTSQRSPGGGGRRRGLGAPAPEAGTRVGSRDCEPAGSNTRLPASHGPGGYRTPVGTSRHRTTSPTSQRRRSESAGGTRTFEGSEGNELCRSLLSWKRDRKLRL